MFESLKPTHHYSSNFIKNKSAMRTNLNYKDNRLLAFLLLKLKNKRVPTYIPLNYIAKSTNLTIDTIRYSLTKLSNYGLIEKWTTSHPKESKRKSYFRLKIH